MLPQHTHLRMNTSAMEEDRAKKHHSYWGYLIGGILAIVGIIVALVVEFSFTKEVPKTIDYSANTAAAAAANALGSSASAVRTVIPQMAR